MVSKDNGHRESMGTNELKILMGLKNFSWQHCQVSELERHQLAVENGMVKPEILKGEQLPLNLSTCPTKSARQD